MAASSPAREQIHIRLSLAPSARAELERIAEQDRRSLASAALVGYRGMVESSASKRGSGTWLIPRPQTRTHRHRRLHRLHPRSRFMRVRTEAGSEWVPRSDLQPSPAPEPSAAPAPGDTPPGPAAVWPVKKPRVVAARGLANGEFVISELKFHRSRRQCCAPCSARRSSAQRLW